MRKFRWIIFFFLAASLFGFTAFSVGVLSGNGKFPPYSLSKKILDFYARYNPPLTLPDRIRQPPDISDRMIGLDVASLISVNSIDQVQSLRKKAIKIIWDRDYIDYKRLPDSVNRDIAVPSPWESFPNLKSIDRITVLSEYGIKSSAYHFHPKIKNNKVVLHHQGHSESIYDDIYTDTIRAFLTAGFSVVNFAMPFYGEDHPTFTLNLGKFGIFPPSNLKGLLAHYMLSYAWPKAGNPLRYFLDPVIVTINYLQKFQYEKIIMTGLSGGGWTTVLTSAMDERIQESYPVAGTLPLFVRSMSSDWGDWEQTTPLLYKDVNYLDLYILAASQERKHVQILNKWDSCCFNGTRFSFYEQSVSDRVKNSGGGFFFVFLDGSHHQHKTSLKVLDFILKQESSLMPILGDAHEN